MPVEVMSVEEIQKQFQATSVCLVRCAMRACEETIAQARRRNSILPEKAVSLSNLSLGKVTLHRIEKGTMLRYHVFSSFA